MDSGCSRHMTRNIYFLLDFKEINGGYVAFRGNPKGGKITGKDNECVVLSSDYKLPDENHVLLRVPRENNMYNVDLKNVVPSRDLTCLFAEDTLDESNLLHRRLGYINFKTMNKLVKGNLVRGLPSKIFENNHTCVACKKGKQHRASWIGPKWLFNVDTLSQSMNYQPVVVGNQPNDNAGVKENLNADYPIWQVIHNGKGPVFVTTDTNEMIKVLPPNTAEEVVAKERERKARTTLLMALPEDHLAKFHKMADAKKTFQTLLIQLETHGAGVSHEDANQKFLRSIPSSWSQVALIMRTKPGLDTFIFDDLYNNLRVFERDVKGRKL
nr:ribonuclease H-like domain-containing protein [Tanacetum cinerariifolium]